MKINGILAAIGSLTLIAGLSAGLAGTAQASTAPTTLSKTASAIMSGKNMSAGSTRNGLASLNWAGFVNTHAGDYAAYASWTVPSVWGPSGYSSSWVGLDGWGSATVEQTGTTSAVLYGQQIDSAWVELYPAPSHDIIYISSGSDVPVHPGDKMTSSVQVIGDGYYAIKLADHTRGWNYTQELLDLAGRNASAEAITEAPASAATGNILPLANFGSVYFTRVNLGGHAKRTTMVARNWRVKASVTGPQSGFAVHFKFAGLFPANLT